MNEGKVKVYSFFNFGDRWGGWLTPRPGRFTPGKETRYPLYRRLGGPQDRSGRVRKGFCECRKEPAVPITCRQPCEKQNDHQLLQKQPHRGVASNSLNKIKCSYM